VGGAAMATGGGAVAGPTPMKFPTR